MRFFHKSGSTLTDYTSEVGRYLTDAVAVTYTAGDYFFIGQDLAFNHFFMKLTDVNTTNAVMTVEYWDGDDWREMVEVTDNTDGMKRSEFVQFTPNRDYSWIWDHTNYNGTTITGLEDVKIYDLFWIRISFDVTLEEVGLKWIGDKFSDDLDLYDEYARLNNTTLKGLFESGKTDWEAQHVKAAEIIIRDLKDEGIIVNAGQILRRQDYKLASICQTAQLIFNGLGDDFKDDSIQAHKDYKQRLSLKLYSVDKNADGELDISEKFAQQGWVSR